MIELTFDRVAISGLGRERSVNVLSDLVDFEEVIEEVIVEDAMEDERTAEDVMEDVTEDVMEAPDFFAFFEENNLLIVRALEGKGMGFRSCMGLGVV